MVIPIYSALKKYGQLKSVLESKGQRIDEFDLLIGSSAIQNKMIMVSSNMKHFNRIPDLHLEDWSKA